MRARTPADVARTPADVARHAAGRIRNGPAARCGTLPDSGPWYACSSNPVPTRTGRRPGTGCGPLKAAIGNPGTWPLVPGRRPSPLRARGQSITSGHRGQDRPSRSAVQTGSWAVAREGASGAAPRCAGRRIVPAAAPLPVTRAAGGPALRVGLPTDMPVLAVPGTVVATAPGNWRTASSARNGYGSGPP